MSFISEFRRRRRLLATGLGAVGAWFGAVWQAVAQTEPIDDARIGRHSGVLLARITGYPLTEEWIVLSLALYVVTGVFWLPVVWMQMRLRDLAVSAVATGAPLPAAYHRLFWTWFAFGFPAFGAVLAILWLMITRPQLGLL